MHDTHMSADSASNMLTIVSFMQLPRDCYFVCSAIDEFSGGFSCWIDLLISRCWKYAIRNEFVAQFRATIAQ
jgi:hypothetical protein